MSDPSSRMLRLLSLLQTHRFWGGPELAGELTVSERTLRRDVDRLRDLGYPVDASRGVGGGYQLRPGSQLPPLLLDDEDAVAIAVGLRTAAGGTVAGIEEASVRALAKLDQVLPHPLRRRVAALQDAIVLTPGYQRAPVDPQALVTISQACRDRERLRFGYRRRDGEASERTVEPHRLVSDRGRWYLVAWDVRREDWRTFRVDRINAPQGSQTRFKARTLPAKDAGEYVRAAIRDQPTRWDAVVTVFAPADQLPPAALWWRGRVEAVDAQTCRIRTSGDGLAWLAVHLGFLEYDYRVESPPELIEHLRVTGARMARAVGGV